MDCYNGNDDNDHDDDDDDDDKQLNTHLYIQDRQYLIYQCVIGHI